MRALVLVIAHVASVTRDVGSAFFAFAFPGLGVEPLLVRARVTLDVGQSTRCTALCSLLLQDGR